MKNNKIKNNKKGKMTYNLTFFLEEFLIPNELRIIDLKHNTIIPSI